jgi:tetratricopeptide (TPR) repeat protein
MSERELFQAAVEIRDPRARAAYLDQACAGDSALRAKVEGLLKSHDEAGNFLNEPLVLDVDATLDQTNPSDSKANTGYDTSAGSPGPSPEATVADSEATGAAVPGAFSNDLTIEHAPTPGPNDQTVTVEDRKVPPARGTMVRYFGDYELQKELGRGGMGVVYKALQVSLNRSVALKMIKAGILADPAELRRFQNEAEAVALLDHPGIVTVHEIGDHDGQRYFSMKLVEGGNLADQLATLKNNPRAAATLLAETAEAIHHAHMRGILHRDLKPANILVDAEGHPHVTDFGLAKVIESDVELTQSGAIMGTPAYMSPEQANGRRGTITTASDIYGLGAIFYALLTGKPPFCGDSVMETLDAVRNRPPVPPTNPSASTPRDLETICLKCLEKDPRRRYASAQALADDLHAWLDSRPISARRVGGAERAWLWCKRKPMVAALVASAMLAAVLGTGAVIAVQTRANRALARKNLDLQASNDKAEAREKQAIDAVKRFGDAVSNNPALKNDATLESLRKELLKEPLGFFKDLRTRLQTDRDTKPESLARLASASFDLAELTEAIGDKQDAISAYREARSLYKKLADDNPAVTDFRSCLAASHHNLGDLMYQMGKLAEAEAEYRLAIPISLKLAADNPAVTESRSSLADSHHRLGMLLWDTGQPAEAVAELRKAIALDQKLADDNPAVTEFRLLLANHQNELGVLLKDTGKPAEAEIEFRKGLAVRQKLADDNPAETEFRCDLAGSHHGLGQVMTLTGRPAEAEAEFRKAIALSRKATDENPTHTRSRQFLSNHHVNLGGLLIQTGRPAEAEVEFRKALELDPMDTGAKTGIKEAEGLAAVRDKLPAFLIGDHKPTTNDERPALAKLCIARKLYRASAGQFADAFAADSKLGSDRRAGHRHNAACTAALAVSGQGKDDPAPDDATEAKLRKQALDWLKAELSAWNRISMIIEPGNKELVARTLTHWKEDADLASIRDASALRKLASEEKAAFEQLWKDVDALLTKVSGGR